MRWFSQIASMLGGNNQAIQRIITGNADLNNPSSKDSTVFGHIIQSVSKEDLASIFSETSAQTASQPIREPGTSTSTSLLSSLNHSSLVTLATTLISALMGHGGFNVNQLTQFIPGLRTTDPDQMDASDVTSLANWTRQNHPQAFGQAAAEIGKQNPVLLQHLLGNRTLTTAASKLAQKYLS
ncbi:MAG: hypothetical protein ACM359_03905 [Bacillota bacterium]